MSDIIEAAARALEKQASFYADEARQAAMIVLATVTPLIRAQALEDAAQVVEGEPFCSTSEWLNDQIAAAIRTLKDKP